MTFTPECPECGEDLVRRKNRISGVDFWGCPLYPQCDGTEEIAAEVHRDYPDWASDPNQ